MTCDPSTDHFWKLMSLKGCREFKFSFLWIRIYQASQLGCNRHPHKWRFVSCVSWPLALCNHTWVLPKGDQRRHNAEILPREAPSADTLRGTFSATNVDLHPSPTKPSSVPCVPSVFWTTLRIKKVIKNSATWRNIKDSQSLRQKIWIHEAFLTGVGIITKGQSSVTPLQAKKLPPEEQQSFSTAREG